MSYKTKAEIYLQRIHRIKSLASFESIWEEAKRDRRLNDDELQAIKQKILRRSQNCWYEKTVRAYQAIHRKPFPYPEDIPDNFEPDLSYPGDIIEAWAIQRAIEETDIQTYKVANQIIREYLPGRYDKLPLRAAGKVGDKNYQLKGSTFYFVRVKDLRYRGDDLVSLKVYLYRDYDRSPQSIIWPPI